MMPPRSRAYRPVAAFLVAQMMPVVFLAGIVLAEVGYMQTLGYFGA